MNGFCAKGGHPMQPHHLNYVCGEHIDTEGYYTHCSVCGQPLTDGVQQHRSWKHSGCKAVAS